MRLYPPKTRKKYFTYSQFKEYLFNHTLLQSDGPNIPFKDFFNYLIETQGKEQAIQSILTMLPFEYQRFSFLILTNDKSVT